MEKRHYTFRGADFLLESISDCVVRVTHVDQVGYVGMSVDWNPDKPYVWATGESQVETEGISALATFEYRTIEEALEPLCGLMLRAQRKRDAQRINPEERKAAGRRVMREFLAELPGGSPLGSGVRIEAEVGEVAEFSEGAPAADRYVEVSLADLCKLADSVGAMMHDLDNGKWKHLHLEINKIHRIVEEWVSDEDILGGGCHDHRCRLCLESGVIYGAEDDEGRSLLLPISEGGA